jgi:hypothetical protein
MKTTAQIKSQLEAETGLKFSVSKNTGSMKHYITFSVKGRAAGVEVDFKYGREFSAQFPFAQCYFSNCNSFSIHKSQICELN